MPTETTSAPSPTIAKRSGSTLRIADAYVTRGLAYQEQGNLDRAIADYNEAIRLNPKNVQAYINRGSAYSGRRDFKRALADLNQAIKLDPKALWRLHQPGQRLRQAGRQRCRHRRFERGDPAQSEGSQRVLQPRSRVRARRDYDRAIADYDEAIRLRPDDAGVYDQSRRGLLQQERP